MASCFMPGYRSMLKQQSRLHAIYLFARFHIAYYYCRRSPSAPIPHVSIKRSARHRLHGDAHADATPAIPRACFAAITSSRARAISMITDD